MASPPLPAQAFTSDDAEVSARWKEEPVARLRTHLVEIGAWGKEEEERLLADCDAEVEAAAEAYLSTPPLPPTAMFEHLYAELPHELEAQREALLRSYGEEDAST